MAEIIGTIVTIQDFLSAAAKSVTIRGKEEAVFELPEGRKYVIPAFQREIRWSKENLNVLIQDIKESNKFLGNVILAASDNNEFFIIDGQQRISVLLMLIFYLKKRWGEKVQQARDFNACALSIESFSAYEALQAKEYDFLSLTTEERETDHYKQSIRYRELWESFAEIKELQTANDVRSFLTNMVRSTLNVILAERDNTNYNIDYFIDVNLKGVRLDVEDIFKGYLFHMNNSKETLSNWIAVKSASMSYNENANSIVKEGKEIYPLTKMLYHFFSCDLYLNDDYNTKGLEFGEDFCLKKPFVKENKTFYRGEHLIKIINDDTYMEQSIGYLIQIIKIFNMIIQGNEPTKEFIELFVRPIDGVKTKSNVDIDEITIIKGLAKYLLLDRKVTLPYALIMKYFLEIVKTGKKIDKKYCERFYAIYAFSVLFSLFAVRKEIKEIESVLQATNWFEKLMEKLVQYFGGGKISDRRAVMECKYIIDDEEGISKHKCKSLAILYNFFKFTPTRVYRLNGAGGEIKKFITDSDQYSVEHFIVNEGGKCRIDEVETHYDYPKTIKRYSDSIFNYLFVPEELNNNTLKNYYVTKKVQLLLLHEDEIKCEYSKMVLHEVENKFSDLPVRNVDGIAEIDAERANEYFGYKFGRQFTAVSLNIINRIIEHIKNLLPPAEEIE